jgi:hypothetical protein
MFRLVVRRLRWHLALALAVALAVVVGLLLRPSDPVDPIVPAPGMPTTRAEVLVIEHGCWSHEAPEGVEARHAVVQLPGRDAELVPARVGFELWLGADGVPASGDERPGLLFAFCP